MRKILIFLSILSYFNERTKTMATASYHHITGMSRTEYDELVSHLKTRFEWGGKFYDIRLIRSILYHRETFGKCKALGEFLETHMQNRKFGSVCFEIQNMHFKTQFTYFKDLVDNPSIRKTRNKATTLRIIDEWTYGIARSLYPDDYRIEEAIERNRKRWASLKMPSMQRKKRGPKKGSHRRFHGTECGQAASGGSISSAPSPYGDSAERPAEV